MTAPADTSTYSALTRAEVKDELVEALRDAIGVFSKIANMSLDLYPDALLRRVHAVAVNSDHQTRDFIGTMIAARKPHSIVDLMVDYIDLLHVRDHPVECMMFSLLSYRNSENFPDPYDRANRVMLADFLINAEAIITTTIYNWDIPTDPETLDNGNLVLLDRNVGGRTCFALGDERLVKLLLERPETAAHVEKIAKERHTLDYEIVYATLMHAAPAMAEGVL